jgi:hypothetical protein
MWEVGERDESFDFATVEPVLSVLRLHFVTLRTNGSEACPELSRRGLRRNGRKKAREEKPFVLSVAASAAESKHERGRQQRKEKEYLRESQRMQPTVPG